MYYARIKLYSSQNPMVVTVEAKSVYEARKIIEAQYKDCKVTTSPTTSPLK